MSKGKSGRGNFYESFQDELDEDSQIQMPTENQQQPEGAFSESEHLGNGVGFSHGPQPKRVRLRAVETEREYFLKLMNVQLFRKLVAVQSISSIIIVFSQVILYAIVTKQTYKALDYVGIGLWGPLVFFSVAVWLTWMTTRSPSGCSIGTAMAFQILTIVVGIILLIFSTISLVQHGQYYYWRHSADDDYDHEIPGRIFCSFVILSAVCVTVAAVYISISFCKLTCCARSHVHETVVFDVEMNDIK